MPKRRKLNPARLPGSFDSRVFIGGSYKAAVAIGLSPRQMLKKLKGAVADERLHAIIADEFDVYDPDQNIHRDAIFLLHACGLAIFELSEFSGAMMEIERSADYGTRCLVLHEDPDGNGWRLSRMLSSFVQRHHDRIRLYGYITEEDARNAARNWLREMLRLKHARR